MKLINTGNFCCHINFQGNLRDGIFLFYEFVSLLQELIRKFEIKPCKVVLSNGHFSKIKMGCTVSDENRKTIPCVLRQTGLNTFSIKIKTKCTKRRQSNETVGIAMHRSDEPASKRQRLEPAQPTEKKVAKKSTALVRVKQPHALGCEKVAVGDVILCKMRGYCPWPAFVTKINGNSVFVEFFGDHTTQKTTLANLYKFQGSGDLVLANLKRLKSPLFSKAVREAEVVLNIPENVSIEKIYFYEN